MKLTTLSDKQLWTVTSEAWTIPVYATKAEDERGKLWWIVSEAILMHWPVRMAIRGVLQPLSAVDDPERWVIDDSKWKGIGTATGGVTPKYWLKHNGEEPKQQELEVDVQPEAPRHNEELIRKAWDKTRLATLGTYKAVWAAAVQQMAKHLIIDQRPLDLGWFTIHAVPYRANWKHNLLAKHPRLLSILNNSAEQRRIAMNVHGVSGDLARTDMMATTTHAGKTVFNWNLEIETSKEWQEYQHQVEVQRLTSSTPNSYLMRWGTIIRDLRPIVNRLLIQFCRSMALSAGQPIKSNTTNTLRLVPFVPSEGGRPTRVDSLSLPLVIDGVPSEVRGPSDQENAYRPTKKVRELPVFQPAAPNLRNSRGDVG